MPWLLLVVAIILEVAGTTCLKYSDGMTKNWPSTFMFIFYACSFWALSISLKTIDVGVAYAIWAGAGVFLIAILGIVVFKEPLTVMKMLSLLLIVAGVVGLHLSGGHS